MGRKDKLNEEMKELLDMIKSDYESIGKLPTPIENPRFYSRIVNLLDIAREEGYTLTIKDVARHLGVQYSLLRKYLSEYRKLEAEGGPAAVEATSNVEIEGLEELSLGSSREKGEGGGGVAREASESPIYLSTATRVLERTKRHLGQKAEDIAKKEAETIIAIGKKIVESYEKTCYMYGFESLEECVDAAFTALFDTLSDYEELKAKYSEALKIIKMLLFLSDEYLRDIFLIDLASKEIIDSLVNTSEGEG